MPPCEKKPEGEGIETYYEIFISYFSLCLKIKQF